MAKITGVPSLNRKLRALRTGTAPAARQGVAKGAEIIVATQKRLVPVLTGALRDSIGWTFGTPPAYAGFQRSQPPQPNETRATIYAGNTSVRYAHLVEFGTVSQTAQPFFYPGYRAERKRAKAQITRAIKLAVQKAAR